jgi:META domain
MTGEDELRGRLLHAAEEFPVRGWSVDLQRRAVRRRRTVAGFALAVGLVAAAGVAVAIPVATGWIQGPDRVAPASTVSADYVGSSWRLTTVAQGANPTAIPPDVGARMDLLADGRVNIDNGVNALSGRFTKSADGFEVRDVGTTLVAYAGNDPRRLAAIAALNTLAYGNRDGVTPSGPARDTVVSADGSRLVVQAGAFRLTFERTGPATDTRPDVPTASGKPS